MNKPNFKKTPHCEITGKIATCFIHYENRWIFGADQLATEQVYWIDFDRFFASPAHTIDWLAHLYEKGWFDPSDFFAMMHRFREATDSFGML